MLRCARFECDCASSEATSWPISRARSIAQKPPSRSRASLSAGSASNALWPWRGAGWFWTSSVDMRPREGSRCEVDNGGDQGVRCAVTALGRQWADQRFADRSYQSGRRRLLVVCFEFASFDSLAQHLHEDVAIAAPEDEPLGLDRRVDRLGDERVRARRYRKRAASERFGSGGDPLARAAAVVGRRVCEDVQLAAGGTPENLGKKLGFGGEMPVHAACGDAG